MSTKRNSTKKPSATVSLEDLRNVKAGEPQRPIVEGEACDIRKPTDCED